VSDSIAGFLAEYLKTRDPGRQVCSFVSGPLRYRKTGGVSANRMPSEGMLASEFRTDDTSVIARAAMEFICHHWTCTQAASSSSALRVSVKVSRHEKFVFVIRKGWSPQ
jgi:hypothetical protein